MTPKRSSVRLLLGTLLVPAAIAQTPGTFTPTGNMTVARFAHTATLLADGRVLIAGGCTDEQGPSATPPFCGNTVTATAELYDPGTRTFVATGSMTAARAYHTATLLPDGRVLVAAGFGGGSSENGTLDSAELYDPLTGTFTATGGLNSSSIIGTNTATLLSDGRVLITGSNTDAALYDPATGTFAVAGDGTRPPPFPTATLLDDGRVLFASPFFTAELFDPGTATFSPTGNGTVGARATLLASGKVLLAGGNDDPGPSSLANLYDPATGNFIATGNMITSRADHTITLLADGRALVAGGSSWMDATLAGGQPAMVHYCCPLNAEVYDPATGLFAGAGGMTAARKGHTATLLRSGEVLIAGGSSGGYPGALVTAEIYHPETALPSRGVSSPRK